MNILVPCGGVYTGTNITITSPNYPLNFTSDAYCVYTVTVPKGRACLQLVDFMAGYLMDFVSVYDGTSIADVPIRQ